MIATPFRIAIASGFFTTNPYIMEVFHMTEHEKALLQARHRLEEAQARDRVKERKVRTRTLIQKGAILEKVMPQTNGMALDELERYLYDLSHT